MGSRIRDFRKVNSEDEILNRVQDNIEENISNIIRTEILDGRLITGIKLLPGVTNSIAHKLSREVRGYFIVLKDSDSSVWDEHSTNTNKKLFLNLRCSAEVTISLWAF